MLPTIRDSAGSIPVLTIASPKRYAVGVRIDLAQLQLAVCFLKNLHLIGAAQTVQPLGPI